MDIELGMLSDHDRVQALKRVVTLPGSPMANPDVEYGYNNHFMTMKQGDTVQYVGFLALDGETFDRLPKTIEVNATTPLQWDPSADHATLPKAKLFNCQEGFYYLPNPKRMELGFYAIGQSELVPGIPYVDTLLRGMRLLPAIRRIPNPTYKAQMDAAREGRRLSKEAKKHLLRQTMDACPLLPTFGLRMAKLTEGTLTRLGAVHPITHKTGKHR